jgi:hypothetical protein
MQGSHSRWVPQPFGPVWLQEWLKRHQHPISFALHMVGIPMTLLALAPLVWDIFSFQMWLWATVLFLGGYALQFLGHIIEGNDMGELILLKKWLGKPYVAISPRWEMAGNAATTSHS